MSARRRMLVARAGRRTFGCVIALAIGIGGSFAVPAAAASEHDPVVTIGSKAFPESWILGEAMAELARRAGASAGHRSNLGGTEIVYQALVSGNVDAYPEYTGTIAEVLLHAPGATLQTMRDSLARSGIVVSDPLGFSDSYALAVTRATATRLGLRRISDLARHPEVRIGLTHEFLGRSDGWPNLAKRYGLESANVRGIQHELAYSALASGSIDATDIYTTDAQIEQLGLVALEDDLGYVGSSRVDLQACKLEYSIVSPK